jgi:hypothetical protein
MRKPTALPNATPEMDSPILNEEELATELIELTCDQMDALTRAFDMISDLCAQLNTELLDGELDIPDQLLN